MLAIYLLLVVVVGTANRVTFKIMQYATINYAYFDSQATILIYVPYVTSSPLSMLPLPAPLFSPSLYSLSNILCSINFAIIFFKMFFTKSITPEMRSFPKYKFAVMGFLDSLQV